MVRKANERGKCSKCGSCYIEQVAIYELVQNVDGVDDEGNIDIGDRRVSQHLYTVNYRCQDCEFKSPRPSDFGLPGGQPKTPGWICPKCHNIDSFEFHMEEGAGLLTFKTGQPTIISVDGSINGTDIKCLNCGYEGQAPQFSVE